MSGAMSGPSCPQCGRMLLCVFALALLAGSSAGANEPLWTPDERQENRDAVFAGRVESAEPLYEVEVPLAPGNEGSYTEVFWVARVEVLDVRKGHPLLEAGPVVDVFFWRGKGTFRQPPYAELTAGDERLLYARTAEHAATDEEVLLVDLASDVHSWDAQGIRTDRGIGRRLVDGEWRLSGCLGSPPPEGHPIRFHASGRAVAENPRWQTRPLAYVERWELATDGTLLLRSGKGLVGLRLHRRADGLFVSFSGPQELERSLLWDGRPGRPVVCLARAEGPAS